MVNPCDDVKLPEVKRTIDISEKHQLSPEGHACDGLKLPRLTHQDLRHLQYAQLPGFPGKPPASSLHNASLGELEELDHLVDGTSDLVLAEIPSKLIHMNRWLTGSGACDLTAGHERSAN